MWPESNEIVFAQIPTFATLANDDYIPIILDPGTPIQEIVYLTDYTAGSNVGTILRSSAGTTAGPDLYQYPSGVPNTEVGYLPYYTHLANASWITGPTVNDHQRCGFSVYNNSAAGGCTLAGGSTWSIIPYNATDYSTGGPYAFLPYLNEDWFAQIGGFYQINARMSIDAELSINIISIWVEGAEVVRGKQSIGITTVECLTVSGVVYLAAGQYFNIQGYASGSGPITVQTTLSGTLYQQLTRMTCHLLVPA